MNIKLHSLQSGEGETAPACVKWQGLRGSLSGSQPLPTPAHRGGPLSVTNRTPILLHLNTFPIVATTVLLGRKILLFFYFYFLEGKTKQRSFVNQPHLLDGISRPLKIIWRLPILQTEPEWWLNIIRGKKTGMWRPGEGPGDWGAWWHGRGWGALDTETAARGGRRGISAVNRVPTSSSLTRAPRIPRTEEMKAHTRVISIPNIFCKLHHMGLTFAEDIFRISVSIPKENWWTRHVLWGEE